MSKKHWVNGLKIGPFEIYYLNSWAFTPYKIGRQKVYRVGPLRVFDHRQNYK